MRRNILANLTLAGVLMASTLVVGTPMFEDTDEAARTPSPEKEADGSAAVVMFEGGTGAERARMRLALERFEEAGLGLPPLRIVFREPSEEECHDALGSLSDSPEGMQVSICSKLEFVYEHELAHAWERATLTDAQRERYTAFRVLPTWSDKDFDWNQRGVEDVAITIQQGLAGLPLAPALSDKASARLQGYEMLTGQVDPRLIEWLSQREVPCPERPTRLSLGVPDVSGRICEVAEPSSKEGS